ncbi:hypothetical protein CNEO_10007 [Clostridium neonatale]|uniref:Transposase IS701-like DDE domain-containing protein n=1 Tax=Clostridium neonatale TaxID=137838 RepID=A0AA86JLJ6_9CLOT|nr:hypothetical protein CNEO_10007 [Clostridium neonatale]
MLDYCSQPKSNEIYMPTTILNQNQFISKYILELNLPYSSAIKNHMVNLTSGIIVTEGNKTISSAYNKLTSNRHRSTSSRFLSSYLWKHEYVTEERIFHAISEISNTCEDNDVGFLIIDDTLSKKNTSTKKSKVWIFIILMQMATNQSGHTVWLHLTIRLKIILYL